MAVHTHESHGYHPMSVIGFVILLAGFAFAGLWLVSMGHGNVAPAVLFGLLMVAAFTATGAIFMSLSHRNHHSPVLPDNTNNEAGRYLRRYRG